jgi:hypothetical protein
MYATCLTHLILLDFIVGILSRQGRRYNYKKRGHVQDFIISLSVGPMRAEDL